VTGTPERKTQGLVEAALRVLVAWNHWQRPDSADMAILVNAFPAWAQLPEDELACQVIHNLSGIAFPEINRKVN